MTVRVLVADDQDLARTGLSVILDAQPDIEVVGQAADGHAAVELARRLTPTCVELVGIEEKIGASLPVSDDLPTSAVPKWRTLSTSSMTCGAVTRVSRLST